MRFRELFTTFALFISVPAFATAEPPPDIEAIEKIVDRHADLHGLPRDFARAVVRVESTWNPLLTGGAGEVGLMQIKFETARYLGYTGTRAELYDPETNVIWAMKYLAGAWQLADSDKCGTVLRYQAGHGAKKMTGAARAYCDRVHKFMVAQN